MREGVSIPVYKAYQSTSILRIMSPGRPSLYSPALADSICNQLSQGESLRTICARDGMPETVTVYRWLEKDEAFQAKYAHARSIGIDMLADEILEIADRPSATLDNGATDTGDVAHRKLQIDTRKWYLSKLAPKKYGDKQQLDIGNADDKPFAIMGDAEASTKMAAIITAGLARKAAAEQGDNSDLI